MSATSLYVTKWALARGILLLKATRRVRQGDHKEWYHVHLPNDPSRMNLVRLGGDAFLTLEEAQADALWRWEEHAKMSATVAAKAAEDFKRVQRGELQLYKHPEGKLSLCHAFKEKEPSSRKKGSRGKRAPAQ